MDPDTTLRLLVDALRELREAEADRARAWAFAASGLLDPAAERAARMGAERTMEEAQERVHRARSLLGDRAAEKAWGGH